jgi:hypothetical protein
MMFRKCSRRLTISLAIVCLTLAVGCLWGAQSSNAFTNFAASQTWSFSSNEWGLACRYRYNTGEWGCTNWFFGPFTATFPLPFGEWSAFYAYANSLGYSEVVYVQDVRLR